MDYSTKKITEWIEQGLMTPQGVLKTLTENLLRFAFSDEEKEQLSKTFDSLATTQDGTKRLDQSAFVSFLHSAGFLPPSLAAAGPILYRSLLYLSQAPFYWSPTPEYLTFDGLVRAVCWTEHGRSNKAYSSDSYCRSRAPADTWRAIFQSLATTRDGSALPYNFEKARSDAERRAFDYPRDQLNIREFAQTNYDEDGDEMFHDLVHALYSVQEEYLGRAPVKPNSFLPLAREYHGEGPYHHLHNLSIPQNEFRIFVKLIVFGYFGRPFLRIEQLQDLDVVVDAIVTEFNGGRDPTLGITWDVFYEPSRVMPDFFVGLNRILSSFYKTPAEESNTRQHLPESLQGSITTLPILAQLSSLDQDGVGINEGFQLQDSKNIVTASALAERITASPTPLILLVSGKPKHPASTDETAVFGYFLPSMDNSDRGPPFLFQLRPTFDAFRTGVPVDLSSDDDDDDDDDENDQSPAPKPEPPSYRLVSDKLVFGEKENDKSNGVALAFSADLKIVSVFHHASGQSSPMYKATESRGDWQAELEVEHFEILT